MFSGCSREFRKDREIFAKAQIFFLGDMFSNPAMDYFIQAKDYAVNVEDVRKFLEIFSKSKEMQYYILGEFHSKMLKNGNLIIENKLRRKVETNTIYMR